MTAVAQPELGAEPIHAHPLLESLDRGIDPVPVSVVYRLGMLAVLVSMVFLIAVYLGLIAAAGYGVYWHVTENTFILGGRGKVAVARFVLYIAPAIVGGILVLFMIKPLLSRRRSAHALLEVTEVEQPVLHAYVRRLADIVRAPRPKAIHIDCQVNASASFARGLLGYLRGDLVLTIGMPLAAGLDVRQFTGVLAHEFGHFAQGGGMRMTYLIRSISGWFGQVVYERDSWDDTLHNQMRHGEHVAIQFVAACAVGMVWVTRQILKGLMYLGMAVSSFMLRQMEFDADRYEARVAGSDTFARTAEKLALLNVAAQASYDELTDAWKERRLCDNLPVLIRGREEDFAPEIRTAVAKHAAGQKTGWFDTHPDDSRRTASAAREASSGIITVDAPAAELFRRFDDLACRATVAFYQLCLGDSVSQKHLVSTDTLVAARSKRKQGNQTIGRYFQGLVTPLCPIFPERPMPVIDRSAAGEMLMELRTQFVAAVPDAREALKVFNDADDRLALLTRARVIVAAGCKLKPADFKLSSANLMQITTEQAQVRANRDEAAAKLHDVLTLGSQRLELALSLAKAPPAPANTVDRGAYDLQATPADTDDPRIAAVLAMRTAYPHIEASRMKYYELTALLSQLKPHDNAEPLINALLGAARSAVDSMKQIREALSDTAYPYEQNDDVMTLARFAVREIPEAENVGSVAGALEYALESIIGLYMRLMSDLSLDAEQMEQSLGLVPLSEPEAEKAPESESAT